MASDSKTQWIDAAYARFSTDGLGGVRVEVLARDIGTTKGSFYWHFTDRAALISEVMERWEQLETEQIIAIADTKGTADERLRMLFGAVAARMSSRAGERTLYISAIDEGVNETVARVTRKRVDYLAALLRELGFDEGEARRRGTIALAAVLGLQQLGTAGDSALTETAYRMVVS